MRGNNNIKLRLRDDADSTVNNCTIAIIFAVILLRSSHMLLLIFMVFAFYHMKIMFT